MARGTKRAPPARTRQRGTTSETKVRAKRARIAPIARHQEDEDEDERARDAQAMAGDGDDDLAALQFLSRTTLPDVAQAGAQEKAKERMLAEKRRQREELNALRPVAQSDSEASTDMEGASESEEEEQEEEEELEDLDDDDDVEDDDDDYEERYLHMAARRERREAAARELRAQQPLPIRTENGIVAVSDDDMPEPHSRAVYSDDDDNESDEAPTTSAPYTPSSAAHSRRFGLAPPYELATGALSPQAALRTRALTEAREQIAHLASQIVSDPEMGTASLQRLLVFAQAKVAPPPGDQGSAVRMHPHIRQLALLSLLAVWVDVIPGYRIRALSEQEQKERVSQEVARRRDWEQSLVRLYRDYLECCEAEVRDTASPLSRVALRCFCTLLVRVPHFNYRKNLLASVIAHLSRKSWTPASEQCASSLIQLLGKDADGEIALELVQLLYRMIRERKFAVHANVLDVLVHLRLRSELRRDVKSGPMGTAHARPPPRRRVDPKQVRQGLAVHRSKKQVKKDRELQAIEQEMREADAALDVEERERNQSETLKLLFALYFRVLKSEVPLPLLASALEGLVHYAHHVSVDFFRDVVGVLRTRLTEALDARSYRAALLCMVAALALQHGQGGALELDLGDMYAALYTVLLPLSTSGLLEEGDVPKRGHIAGLRRWSEASMLFYAMDMALVQAPRATLQVSLERTAALVRRLLGAALHWPTTSALRALELAQAILARTATIEARFEALLDNRDAVQDGQYDPLATQPESARALASGEPCWELCLLSRTHANAQVRETATALLHWTR
ncbi:hypothetical protein MEQU1_002139 [Malassezia equina]|uniref:Nucleolar complex-associated protein 3 n=1 Tax=Malassezia equina TaxID=1381935 RepID=A0AAF0EFH1_9BASI|nr:hypothetical protein MEQU1_002139 [Malassezia equina]